jgi:hypothetical protein
MNPATVVMVVAVAGSVVVVTNRQPSLANLRKDSRNLRKSLPLLRVNPIKLLGNRLLALINLSVNFSTPLLLVYVLQPLRKVVVVVLRPGRLRGV